MLRAARSALPCATGVALPALLALVALVCLARPAAAEIQTPPLGDFERLALDEVLAREGLALEPAPDGKTIRRIHVVNLPVFAGRGGYSPYASGATEWTPTSLGWRGLQLASRLHVTTHTSVIRRELLFAEGDRYDRELVEETSRSLRDPEFSSLVVVVPVISPAPGKVDVLVVTRDVWSLRFNTNFEYQEGRLIYASASLSENNLFGLRKRASLSFLMNQGALWAGPTYFDPNIRGTRLTLSASAGAWFGRDGGRYEGTSSQITLAYPLWALSRKWGGSFAFSHADHLVRDFLGTRPRRIDLEETPDDDRLDWTYRLRRYVLTSSAVRSFGQRRLVQRVRFGHQWSVQRPTFMPAFTLDPVVREAFARRVFPRSERVSQVFMGWSLFTPRYRVYRDLNTYDLREDSTLGPTASLGLGAAAVPLGSEHDFLNLSASAGWNFDLLDGFQRLSAGFAGRQQDGALIDQAYSAGIYLATPVLLRAARVVGEAGVAILHNARENVFYALGGDSGLRGYTIGDFRGRASALGHLEVRTRPLPFGSLRLGTLAFWDVGHVAARFAELRAHHDVGAGLRLLIPQLNPYVIRLDWAFALQTTPNTRAGWPGRISAGFQQAF
jgi:hypothetical protein